MKKYVALLLIIFTALLSACDTTSSNDVDVLDTVKEELTLDATIEGIQLPTNIDGVTITWSTSNEKTLTSYFMVVQGSEDVAVILEAALVYDGRMVLKEFAVTILHKEIIEITYEGYYEGSGDISGDTLKTFLYNLIKDHSELSYDDLRQALQVTDADPTNPENVILLYTGQSVDGTWDYGVTWNREHVWPRSLGDMERSDAEHNDLHHIRASDPSMNSLRSNLDFDEGGRAIANSTCFKDGDSFEPRDEVKGDVARMLFYMAVRYEGFNGEIDLEINELVDNNAPNIGILSILLQWHLEDPVDQLERDRNDLIFGYQGNRNPFIDHPEFANLIWGN